MLKCSVCYRRSCMFYFCRAACSCELLKSHFVESAPKDRFILHNTAMRFERFNRSSRFIERVGAPYFDNHTATGAGVEVFPQPFEVKKAI